MYSVPLLSEKEKNSRVSSSQEKKKKKTVNESWCVHVLVSAPIRQ